MGMDEKKIGLPNTKENRALVWGRFFSIGQYNHRKPEDVRKALERIAGKERLRGLTALELATLEGKFVAWLHEHRGLTEYSVDELLKWRAAAVQRLRECDREARAAAHVFIEQARQNIKNLTRVERDVRWIVRIDTAVRARHPQLRIGGESVGYACHVLAHAVVTLIADLADLTRNGVGFDRGENTAKIGTDSSASRTVG